MCLAAIGRLCEKCDGKCPICDSYVRPATLVRICDECNYGSYEGRCVICGGVGVSDAYYCKECTLQEKDVSRLGWCHAHNNEDAAYWWCSTVGVGIAARLSVVRPWIAVGSGMQQVLCLIYVPYCSDKHVSDHLPPGHLHAT